MGLEAYEFTVSGILSGQFVQNVFHVNVNNVGNENPYIEALDIINTLNATVTWFDLWVDCLPNDYQITSARCRRVLATGGPTAIVLAGDLSAQTGNRTGSIQAAQVNPVLVWLTTLRPNRPGKTFLPGLSETDMDDMIYTSGILAAYALFIPAVTTGFTLDGSGDTANFGVYRHGLGASDDISNGRVSPLVGTQRRRLRPV